MLVLKIKNTAIGKDIIFMNILYGEATKYVVNIPIKDKDSTYIILCFLVVSIFNNVVNNNIVIVTSIKLQGISSTLINSSFVVVSAVQTALKVFNIFLKPPLNYFYI
jgi:hypothetical protein